MKAFGFIHSRINGKYLCGYVTEEGDLFLRDKEYFKIDYAKSDFERLAPKIEVEWLDQPWKNQGFVNSVNNYEAKYECKFQGYAPEGS